MRLLHIDSSIRGDLSASRKLSLAITQKLRRERSFLDYNYCDLVAAPLSHLTSTSLDDPDSQAALSNFLAADIVVIGVGMYNFTIPTQLKAWIDRIVVAGRTFRYGATGAEGLAGTKTVIIALSRGGFYTDGSSNASLQHDESYLRGAMAFIGIAAPIFVIAEGMAVNSGVPTAMLQALKQIEKIDIWSGQDTESILARKGH